MKCYPVYDAAWQNTGWATEPQYPGQAPVSEGWPLICPGCLKPKQIIRMMEYREGFVGTDICGFRSLATPIEDLV